MLTLSCSKDVGGRPPHGEVAPDCDCVHSQRARSWYRSWHRVACDGGALAHIRIYVYRHADIQYAVIMASSGVHMPVIGTTDHLANILRQQVE